MARRKEGTSEPAREGGSGRGARPLSEHRFHWGGGARAAHILVRLSQEVPKKYENDGVSWLNRGVFFSLLLMLEALAFR